MGYCYDNNMLIEETIDKLNHLVVQLPIPEKILITIEQFVKL